MATLSEAFQIALQHHQAGRLDLAEQVYRQILNVEPNHADSLHLLGLIAYQAGQYPMALEMIRQAVARNPMAAVYHNSLGLTCRGLGRTPEAIASFRRAVELDPRCAAAYNNLGNGLREEQRIDEAIACFRRTLELDPGCVPAHSNLGSALQTQGKSDAAATSLRKALELDPNYAEAHNNLGLVWLSQGKQDEALACFQRAVQLNPEMAEALDNLGSALRDEGRLDEAIAYYHAALQKNPNYVIAHNNLGNALKDQRKLAEAIESYGRALAIKPDYAEAHHNLGTAFRDCGRQEAALDCFRRALQLKPALVESYDGMGNALQALGRFEEAVAAFRQALRVNPDYADAHNNLGVALYSQGKPEEALVWYRRALELKPDFALAHSNCLNAMQYRPGITPAELLEAHLQWDRQHGAPLRSAWAPHDNTPDPDRVLRVGFSSPSFAWQPAARFLIGAFEQLDHSQMTVVCYSDRALPDEMTARFQAAADTWRDVVGMPEAALARQIRDDRIDILFDLAGHTGPNRLLTFARKPAPIQITWLDYEGTTGLSAMDYLLADPYEIPVEAERWCSEKVLRLPDDFGCYEPPAGAPPVGPLPALTSGRVTFGSFNLPAKMTPEVIETWARILQRTPQARLLLKYRGLEHAAEGDHFRQLFAAQGIDLDRVELQGWSEYNDMLECYNGVDLALDTFPYNGGLTTCEALWMGVPVVTFPGETFASRHGLTHLTNVGLTETVAADRDDYVALAVALAGDLPRLAALRAGLREQVANSRLCDGKRFAANLVSVLRDVWRDWCRRQGKR